MSGEPASHWSAELEKLFRDHAAGLAAFARTLPPGRTLTPEDAVQEAFVAAAEAWDRCLCPLDEQHRRAWLRTVVRNKTVDDYRRGARGVPVPIEDEIPLDQARETDRQVLDRETARQVWATVARMPPSWQRVAFLKWHEMWKTPEIAEHLGLSQSAVRGYLKKARDEIASVVGPDGLIAEDDTEGDDRQSERRGWRRTTSGHSGGRGRRTDVG